MSQSVFPKDPNDPKDYLCLKCHKNFRWAPPRPAKPWDFLALLTGKNNHPRCPSCGSHFVSPLPDLCQN